MNVKWNPPQGKALSPREKEVISAVVDGRKHPEIRAMYKIKPGTLSEHISRIRKKLGATTIARAAVIWDRMNPRQPGEEQCQSK